MSIIFIVKKFFVAIMLTIYVVNDTIFKLMDLKRDIDCFLLDLDGTVYFGDRLIDGAKDGIERMKKSKRVIFLTNNSSATRDHYVKKLTGMGIDVTEDDVYTSANATRDWLKTNRPNAKLYIVASPEVQAEFEEAGLYTRSDKPDTVLLTFDKTLDYQKLVKSCDLIKKGAFYIATHPDMTCPVDGGDLPDIGSFMLLIEGTTGKRPDLICGKPYGIMAECIAKMTGVPLSRTAMIGDRLSTDMLFAVNNGIRSVLTLTGETSREDHLKSGMKVDKIIDSIAEWDK